MDNLLEFLTSKEIILVYFIAGLSCFICFIVYLVERNNEKLRRKHNTKELNKLVEQIKEKIPEKEETVIYEEPVLEVISESASVEEMLEDTGKIKSTEDVSNEYQSYVIEPVKYDETIEELEYTSIEPDMETAKLELKKLEEQLLKEEEAKMEVLEVEEDNNIELTEFEDEQEKDAIISLDEYMSKGKELYEANEFVQYEDDGNEPISIQDLETRMENKNVEVIEEKKPIEDLRIEPKFKNSPIISPIFGIEGINNESVNELELENTANYEKLDQEIKKTNEFLMTLKELQNKLD